MFENFIFTLLSLTFPAITDIPSIIINIKLIKIIFFILEDFKLFFIYFINPPLDQPFTLYYFSTNLSIFCNKFVIFILILYVACTKICLRMQVFHRHYSAMFNSKCSLLSLALIKLQLSPKVI